MEAFLELQKQLYQFSALVHSGVADIKQLSDADRQSVQISVLVTSGSANLDADYRKALTTLLVSMVGKMSGRQAAIVALGLAMLVGAGWGFSAWLEHQKELKLAELKSKEHVSVLEALGFAQEGETERLRTVMEALANSGVEGRRALAAANAINDALLRAASRTAQSTINDHHLTQEEAESLRASPRTKPVIRHVKQQMRVVDINTADPDDLQIVLMDDATGEQFRVKLVESLFSSADRPRLFTALESRAPIWLELAFKESDAGVRSVDLLRVVDDPTMPTASQ